MSKFGTITALKKDDTPFIIKCAETGKTYACFQNGFRDPRLFESDTIAIGTRVKFDPKDRKVVPKSVVLVEGEREQPPRTCTSTRRRLAVVFDGSNFARSVTDSRGLAQPMEKVVECIADTMKALTRHLCATEAQGFFVTGNTDRYKDFLEQKANESIKDSLIRKATRDHDVLARGLNAARGKVKNVELVEVGKIKEQRGLCDGMQRDSVYVQSGEDVSTVCKTIEAYVNDKTPYDVVVLVSCDGDLAPAFDTCNKVLLYSQRKEPLRLCCGRREACSAEYGVSGRLGGQPVILLEELEETMAWFPKTFAAAKAAQRWRSLPRRVQFAGHVSDDNANAAKTLDVPPRDCQDGISIEDTSPGVCSYLPSSFLMRIPQAKEIWVEIRCPHSTPPPSGRSVLGKAVNKIQAGYRVTPFSTISEAFVTKDVLVRHLGATATVVVCNDRVVHGFFVAAADYINASRSVPEADLVTVSNRYAFVFVTEAERRQSATVIRQKGIKCEEFTAGISETNTLTRWRILKVQQRARAHSDTQQQLQASTSPPPTRDTYITDQDHSMLPTPKEYFQRTKCTSHSPQFTMSELSQHSLDTKSALSTRITKHNRSHSSSSHVAAITSTDTPTRSGFTLIPGRRLCTNRAQDVLWSAAQTAAQYTCTPAVPKRHSSQRR